MRFEEEFFILLSFMPLVSFSQETVKTNRLLMSIGFIQNQGNIATCLLTLNYKYMEDGYRVETSLTALYGESRDVR